MYYLDTPLPQPDGEGGVASPPPRAAPPVHAALQTTMTVLRLADSQVHAALTRHGVELAPFALRWLRLLFLRELTLSDALQVWDVTLRLHFERGLSERLGLAFPVSLVAALIVFVRSYLVLPGADEVSMLSRLMRMPPVADAGALISSAEALLSLLPDVGSGDAAAAGDDADAQDGGEVPREQAPLHSVQAAIARARAAVSDASHEGREEVALERADLELLLSQLELRV